MSGPTLFMIGSQTPYLWLPVSMRFIRVGFPPPPPLMSAPFLPFVLHLPHNLIPSILLHMVPAIAILSLVLGPHAVPTHLPSVGIVGILLTRPEVSCTMFFVGKLAGWQVNAFSLPAGSMSSSLVYLQDKLSSRQFLADYRASISFSGCCLILHLQFQASHFRWFLCLVFRFQDHSSRFWFL